MEEPLLQPHTSKAARVVGRRLLVYGPRSQIQPCRSNRWELWPKSDVRHRNRLRSAMLMKRLDQSATQDLPGFGSAIIERSKRHQLIGFRLEGPIRHQQELR